MPLGSSSAAPVIRPGPSWRSQRPMRASGAASMMLTFPRDCRTGSVPGCLPLRPLSAHLAQHIEQHFSGWQSDTPGQQNLVGATSVV